MNQTSLSAGAIPIRAKNGSWEVLLLRSFRYWDFPKGMVETGEDPWDAAIREIEEETGYSITQLDYLLGIYENKKEGFGISSCSVLVRFVGRAQYKHSIGP